MPFDRAAIQGTAARLAQRVYIGTSSWERSSALPF
jgi:hypothetical protein